MKQDIHPNYQPVVFMDSTTGFKFFQVQLKDLQKLLNGKMAILIHYYVLRLLQTHTHSTLVVKNSHKPTDVWTVSTKIRSQRRKRKSRRIVFQNIVMTEFIEVFHCGGKPLFCWIGSFKFREII